MANDVKSCPICKWNAHLQHVPNRDAYQVECRRCGRFVMTGMLLSGMKLLNEDVRLSQFVVADFTLQRAGVYFEAGFAMGLGRDVIWTCREDDFENTHFDTRQYNHVVWSTPEDLKAKLTDRIRATVIR